MINSEETKVVEEMGMVIDVEVIEMLVKEVDIKDYNHKNSHLAQYLEITSHQFQCVEVVRKIKITFKIYCKRNIKIK